MVAILRVAWATANAASALSETRAGHVDASAAASALSESRAGNVDASVASSAVSDSPAGHVDAAASSALSKSRAGHVDAAVSSSALSEPRAGHVEFSLVSLNADRFVRELESDFVSMNLGSLGKATEHAKSVLSFIKGTGGGFNLRGEPVGVKANSQRPSHVEPELWDPLTRGQKKDKLALVKTLQSKSTHVIKQLDDRAVTLRGHLALECFKGPSNSIVIPHLKA